MAERLAEVTARRRNIEGLRQVVDAMRSLAAVRQRQAADALPAIRAYAGIMAAALARGVALLDRLPTGGIRPVFGSGFHADTTVILFTPEHGFTGAFTERLLAAVADAGALWVVGSRGVLLAQERGRAVGWSTAMATHTDAVPATARAVAEALYARALDGTLGRVDVVYPRVEGMAERIVRDGLLPVDPARVAGAGAGAGEAGPPPLVNLEPQRLVERLADEYLFAQLMHAAMESFAAENAARLAVMVSARRNVDETLSTLAAAERRLRQDGITNEVIELSAGGV